MQSDQTQPYPSKPCASQGEGAPPQRPNPPRDLDACPRCGQTIGTIIWGQTNCPRCGLHFECC